MLSLLLAELLLTSALDTDPPASRSQHGISKPCAKGKQMDI